MLSQEQNWLLEEKYQGVVSAAFYADAARLEAGEPLAYLIGSIPFLNTIIYLDSRPLIPRPETEYWVETVIKEIEIIQEESKTPLHILDLCAGSGCIGIAIAKAVPKVQIDFIELEEKHLSTIKKNCLENSIAPSRYHIWQGNLFNLNTNDDLEKYDFIISNPPYIDKSLDRTEKSVQKYEPAVALYGGESGMEIIRQIIHGSTKYLHPKGQLWLEHEPEQISTIKQLADSHFTITPHLDQYKVVRFTQLMLK